MANSLYSKGLQAFLAGSINWGGDTIKAALINTSLYTLDLTNHSTLADIPVGARVSISPAFTGKTGLNGVADANDVEFLSVTGPQCAALVIYKDGGTDATSPLIAYIDSASGLPVTPGGSNISVIWDGGPNKIFRL